MTLVSKYLEKNNYKNEIYPSNYYGLSKLISENFN